MRKPQLFMYTGLITTALMITLNVKILQFHETHRKKMTENKLAVPGVCRDIFEVGRTRENMSEMTSLTVETIFKTKERKSFLPDLYYEILSFESPSMILKNTSGREVEGKNFTLKEEWRLQQVKGQLNHLSCRLREYSPKDVQECAKERRKKDRNTTHLLYIGDSRIRQHVEVLIDHLRDLDLKITTYKGEILSVEDFLGEKGSKEWSKYKHNFRVESRLIPGFLIEFNWAALLDWGDKPKLLTDNISFGMKHFLTNWTTEYSGNSISSKDWATKSILAKNVHTKKEDLRNKSHLKESTVKGESKSSVEYSSDEYKRSTLFEKQESTREIFNSQSTGKTDSNVNKALTETEETGEEYSKQMKVRVGAFEILSRLNSSPEEDLPDIVLINTGAWLLEQGHNKVLETIDHSTVIVIKTLWLRLKKLAKRTTVVWLAPDPIKEHVFHTFNDREIYTYETNTISEWLLNAQALLLPPKVLFWDSFLPVAHASRSDCMYMSSENVNFPSLPKYRHFSPTLSWNCLERVHLGLEALTVAAQMSLNHVCNPYLEKGYCCSDMS